MFPQDQEVLTPLVDGEDFEEAANVNNVDDKVSNVIDFLGIAGNPQSKLAALNRFFKYVDSLLPGITWIDDDTIEIAACWVPMWSGVNCVFKERSATLQIKLSVNLDTGSETSSTYYYIYLCGDSSDSQWTAVFSASATAPTGYTYYKKIGKIYNDSSSNLGKAIIEYKASRSFGAWEAKTDGTAYQAETDGFFAGSRSGFGDIFAYSDSSNPPTQERAGDNDSQSYHGSFCIPVRAGDYYKSSGANVGCWWMPFTSLT